MSPRKKENQITFLEPRFSDVFVSGDETQPLIESFVQEGENVSQKSLGMVFGVLEITDRTEESFYIVNYVISVIKKEYFSREKRGAIESLESALHKGNLALSKLAQHGNVSWLGNFNALVGVIEKNNLHFSIAGKASGLLIRNRMLTDISSGMNEEGEPNPIKTFTNISSGKLEEGDKLILSTPGIFEVFSLEEIKRAASNFSKEKFLQFFRTALSNSIDLAAVLICDLEKKSSDPSPMVKQDSRSEEMPNAFSQKTFYENKRSQKGQKIKKDDLKQIAQEERIEKDKKGHLYIKEDSEPVEEEESMARKSIQGIDERISSIWLGAKKHLLKNDKRSEPKTSPKDIFLKGSGRLGKFLSEKSRQGKALAVENWKRSDLAEKAGRIASEAGRKSGAQGKRFLYAISRLDIRQKSYLALAILLIFIVPIFINKWINSRNTENPSDSASENPLVQEQPAPDGQKSDRIEISKVSDLGESPVSASMLGEKLFLVFEDGISSADDPEKVAFPEGFGAPQKSASMEDLGLIFILDDNNRLISFSPNNNKFQDNSIEFPEGTRIDSLGTFLTYLYVLDSGSNQIYRYPRAEGGFGERFDWIRDTGKNINGFHDMSVSEDIFLTDGNSIKKFNRGKEEDFQIPQEARIENISSMATDEDGVFLLDEGQDKIIVLDNGGKILEDIQDGRISGTRQIFPEEEGHSLLLVSEKSIQRMSIK